MPGPNPFAWLAVFSSLFLIIGLALNYWIHSQHQFGYIARPGASPGPGAPLVSIIIPARDEARNIQPCVEAALAQAYPSLEVIVVNDRSTDDTPRLLAELQAQHQGKAVPALHIVHGVDLPPGWAGKPHALAQGAAVAQGEWLCLIDADTFATPDLVASIIALAIQQQADLFSFLTRQEMGSFWEKIVLPVIITALSVGFSPRRVNDRRKPDAIAYGQCILIRRQVYDAVGGYQAIRDHIVEDKALAELVKRGGHRLLLGDGSLVAHTRMYTSFSEIWEGWTKNIYLGMREHASLLLFGALVGLAGALILPVWVLGGSLGYLASHQPLLVLVALEGLVLWMVLLSARWRICQSLGVSPGYAFLFPLGAAVFTALVAASVYKVLSGRGVTWKGRRYPGIN